MSQISWGGLAVSKPAPTDEYANLIARHKAFADDDVVQIMLMRKYQKLYFETKDRDTLILAKRMEARVDAIIERIIKAQPDYREPSLFEEGA